jgi:hypothetical protein
MILTSGCLYGMGGKPPAPVDLVPGFKLYNVDALSNWKYSVTMDASNTISSWDIDITRMQDSLNGTTVRRMEVNTAGNGMDIQYDIWSNLTNYNVYKMYAKGRIGDYFQEREVSRLQIYTIPDIGLAYYFVPFSVTGNITINDKEGKVSAAKIYSATDNKGFTINYLIHEAVPVPLKIEMADKNFRIVMALADYK